MAQEALLKERELALAEQASKADVLQVTILVTERTSLCCTRDPTGYGRQTCPFNVQGATPSPQPCNFLTGA